MSVDKLVDSTQLDADLTSVANAIRTKGGTSASLAFPAGFVTAIQNIPSGGGNDNYILKFENFKFNSSKWILNGCLLNPFKNGGCVHITYTKQNTGSSDAHLICFGIGALSNWSPGASTAAYVIDYKSGNSHVSIRFRGTNIDGTLHLDPFEDGNGELDIKLYSDRIVDVKTGTSTPLTDYAAAVRSAMTSLSSPTYLSVGTNQTAPISGIIQTLFAFESS